MSLDPLSTTSIEHKLEYKTPWYSNFVEVKIINPTYNKIIESYHTLKKMYPEYEYQIVAITTTVKKEVIVIDKEDICAEMDTCNCSDYI